MHHLLSTMTDSNASDMYVTVGRPIMLRIEDHMRPITPDSPIMMPEMIYDLLKEVLNEKQMRDFMSIHEMNVSFGIAGKGRYRINALQQRQSPSMVIRSIKQNIPAFHTLGLPEDIKQLALNKRGIILLCGMTGSGKSTTLASMLDYRNETTSGHIITIEDPVEYLYQHKKSIVSQREVGTDTDSYHIALKNAFRQKPDVILVGEIRDRYVMEQALVAAETGHLCMSTIHANNTYQAIERVLNFFEDVQLNQVRMNLAMNIRAIISQRLIHGKDGRHILAFEIMLNEGYVRELILKGETNKIREVMAQNKMSGMVTFDQTLLRLYQEDKIEERVAIAEADMPVDMELQIRKLSVAASFNTSFGR
ncbi:MAG: twitching motility family protein [Alphaproteobacteria bacterium]|nr:twitching motility family protein [Alphaproteobacteria bacterium]